ncbi:MAG: hypothetical protein LUH05_00135 [Candidatus Gastranaerophilales bacterium]|nr:hypothetical protein [Candidatus Gastranaerophilales bacterium]
MITLEERNNNIKNNNRKSPTFKGAETAVLSGAAKAADIFIKSQENLSSTRFIQDTATNWLPKAVFARSKADFAEMSFLEFLESGIFYFASPLLGEKLFRNHVFNKFQPESLRSKINEQIPKTVQEITKNTALSDEVKKRAISTKAGIVLACTAIPVAEYTLSFAKNLFTLKTFNKSNFNNIANLDKTKSEKEDKAQQERVENNSKKQLKKAAILSAAGVAAGSALAIYGHKSDTLQKISKTILEPGKAAANLAEQAGVHSDKLKNTLGRFSLDFANNNGKLALSKGQLALTAILGLFGYSKAAEDRGKLDVAEVWTRVPLVVFYTIFGGELFEKGFTKILEKKNKFPDILQKTKDGKLNIPTREQLPALAEKLSKTKNTKSCDELARLTKEKAFVSAVPYAFSLLFMGFTLSAITRLWTQYRYNHQQKDNAKNTMNFISFAKQQTPEIYKTFEE